MPPLLKNTIKNTLLGFAVGAIASMLLPAIAAQIFPADAVAGVVGNLGNPAWLGGFVAALNAVTTLASPVFDHLFGDKPAHIQNGAKAESNDPMVTLYLNQEPEVAQAAQPEKQFAAEILSSRTQNTAGIAK